MKSVTMSASAVSLIHGKEDFSESIPALTNRYLSGSLTYNAQEIPIAELRSSLIDWYSNNRRKLPWRGDLDDEGSNNKLQFETLAQKQERRNRVSAYGTWVSEIMCQQTKVETVINYWKRWMTEYPTIEDLATASPDDVNKLWAGLGYYRRAQQLLLGAKKVVDEFGGRIPAEKANLLRIPGIGPYTAGAISSIAFHAAEPVVDGNVVRVLSRLYAIDPAVASTNPVSNMEAEGESEEEDSSDEKDERHSAVVIESTAADSGKATTPSTAQIKKTASKNIVEKLCWTIAAELVDPQEPGDFNQALMELGATVCKPTSPDCVSCPIRDMCRAKKLAEAAATLAASSQGKGEEVAKAKKARVQTTLNNFFVAKPTSISQDRGDQISKSAAEAMTFSEVVLERCHLLPKDVTYFPVKQAKKAPREVAVAVYVLALTCSDAKRRFLFLRRPPTGLLANQWEFPSIASVVTVTETTSGSSGSSSGSANLASAQSIEMTHLKSYLRTKVGANLLLAGEIADRGGRDDEMAVLMAVRSSVPCVEPSILHIFSHERHNMAISIWEVDLLEGQNNVSPHLLSSSNPNMWMWMTAEEIRTAGITTGCKKILVAVEKSFNKHQLHLQSSTAITIVKGKKKKIILSLRKDS